jgi:hypothetical protein
MSEDLEHRHAAATERVRELSRHLGKDTRQALRAAWEEQLQAERDLAAARGAAVEVACWCPEDHNMHQVRQGRWQVSHSHELVQAFAAGTAMLTDVLVSGPAEPHPWRVQAGLPDAPDPSR